MSANNQGEATLALQPGSLDDQSKRGKKGKGAGKRKGSGPRNAGTSIATHPRARAAVSRAKGWGGLCGFVIAAVASYGAHVPLVQAGLRALAAGVGGYVLAWMCAVAICRNLVQSELRSIAERLREAREAAANSAADAADATANAAADG